MFCYSFRFITLVFIFIACAGLLKRKNKFLYFNCVILLGGMIFHCIWEANSKYLVCSILLVSCLFISARCLNSGYISAAVQNESTENFLLGRKEGDIISQSFDTKINFNTIIIPVRKFYTESRIEVTLSEEK